MQDDAAWKENLIGMGSGPGVPKLLHHNGKVWCPLTGVMSVRTVNVVLHIKLATLPSMLTSGQAPS